MTTTTTTNRTGYRPNYLPPRPPRQRSNPHSQYHPPPPPRRRERTRRKKTTIVRTGAASGYGRQRATRSSRSGDSTWMRNARTAGCPSPRPPRTPSGARSPTRTGKACDRRPFGNRPCHNLVLSRPSSSPPPPSVAPGPSARHGVSGMRHVFFFFVTLQMAHFTLGVICTVTAVSQTARFWPHAELHGRNSARHPSLLTLPFDWLYVYTVDPRYWDCRQLNLGEAYLRSSISKSNTAQSFISSQTVKLYPLSIPPLVVIKDTTEN